MYTQKQIREWFERRNTKYIYIIGYDGDIEKGYTDVMIQWSDSAPTVRDMLLYMDFYKPLEVRGSYRRLIWCEVFDRTGMIDVSNWTDGSEFKYIKMIKDFPEE